MATARPRNGSDLAVSQAVGRNVRRLRKARHLRQLDLAEKITAAGFPMRPSVVSKLEAGRHHDGSFRSVSVDELVAVAQALGVRPEQLLVPFECEVCKNTPPPGFTCATCGVTTDRP
ncbi:helix-turn-helix transcriptional regulator [Streptomyces sp. NPDC094472]|uniref:helix-turn-helix domain-containing protein n=1 Tax=Streptomyces sp. NPDC094472 TaxID=3155080 RepID=UPI003329F60D